MDNLDAAYRYQIRPTLDALEPRLLQLGRSLFRFFRQGAFISRGTSEVNGSGLLLPAHWQNTKDEHILSAGFALSDSQPLEIRAEFSFDSYTGQGDTGFSMRLVIKWGFGSSCLQRRFDVDSMSIPPLAGHFD